MKDLQKTSNGTKGGLFVGKSHAKGGIPAIVVDTGQPIEVEGGEVIINKEASKKYWKELSKINQSAGNGVPIPPPIDFEKEVSSFKGGGTITMSAIRKGTEMEMEHQKTINSFKKSGITTKEVARRIAQDHLKENPNYYKIISKLKLAKGGEIICRSCGWDWHEKNAGTDKYICHDCNEDNSAYYKKGGITANMSKSEIKEFYNTPEGRKLDAETYKEWKSLVNMSKAELKEFYNSKEGKEAGLSDAEANRLGIDNGRTSARWIMKMKDVPFVNWNYDMWVWAKKQISFIKRMSGNKGSLYDEKGNKTRKHTSLLIWGHNPEKFNGGGNIPKIKETYALVVKISNIDFPNEIKFKGTKNKYLGTYKKIFDILNEDLIFNEVYAVDDVLVDNDLYVFFESNFEADKYDKISKLKNVEIISVMSKGGRTIAQTPAPQKDRIKGSFINPKNTSENSVSAEKITFSEQTLESIENILREHNKTSEKKVDFNTAKAVVRRGMGAYSTSYRPTISGGKPNNRVAWGLARLKAFLYKIENKKSKSGKYSQDNDLIEELGYDYEKYSIGGQTKNQQKKIGVVMHEFKEGNLHSYSGQKVTNPKQAIAIALSEAGASKYAKGKKISENYKGGNCYEVAGKIAMNERLPKEVKEYNLMEFQGTPYVVHAEVSGQGVILGLRYGHAWIEDDLFVYDFSNGREITLPKQLYYQWGDVKLKAPKYYKYTFKQAIDKMLETGHYGSWDLKTESGL